MWKPKKFERGSDPLELWLVAAYVLTIEKAVRRVAEIDKSLQAWDFKYGSINWYAIERNDVVYIAFKPLLQ